MSRKSIADTLIQRMNELEIELAHLRKVTSSIHSSPLYKAEKSLIARDQLADHISDGITVLDQSGIILFINRAAEKQYNRLADKLTGKSIQKFIHSVGADTEYLQAVQDAFHNKIPKVGEYIINFTNDHKLLMHLTFLIREDPLSTDQHLWIIHRDISQVKQLEEELKCSKERLNSIIESYPDIILNVDLNGTILFINMGTKSKRSEQIIGTSIFDYTLPEDCDVIRAGLKRVFETGDEGRYESSGIDLDGIVRWYSTRLTPIKHDNQVIAATLCVRDNSDKKETEEELKNSQKMLNSVLHSIPGILVVLDKKFNILASNCPGLEICNPSDSGSDSKCYGLCWHKDHPCTDCLAVKVFKTGKPVKMETFHKHDNGYKEISVYPVLNDVGSVRYVVEHIQDITLRKKSEEKMVLANLKTEAAQKLKTDFLSKISHDLKTPMIGILGFSKLGIERHKKVTKDKLKSYFSTILESGEKLQILLNNLVDLSQLEAGSMGYDYQNEKLSMVTTIILNEMFILLKESRIEVDYDKPGFTDRVTMDVDRIGKVIRNLVTNAIKFSIPGSRIKVVISEEDNQVQFAVTDTGECIPENELTSIFEQFSRTSNPNPDLSSDDRGLGLAISKKIITDHKGAIWAENGDQGGLVFKFMLPKSQATEPNP